MMEYVAFIGHVVNRVEEIKGNNTNEHVNNCLYPLCVINTLKVCIENVNKKSCMMKIQSSYTVF